MNYSRFLNIFRNGMLFLADFSSFRYVVFKNNNLKTKLRSLTRKKHKIHHITKHKLCKCRFKLDTFTLICVNKNAFFLF